MEMLVVHQEKATLSLYLVYGVQELTLCVFRGSKTSMSSSAVSRNPRFLVQPWIQNRP